MTARVEKNGLKIDKALHDFIVEQAIPGTGVNADAFFAAFGAAANELAVTNRALLAKRDALQEKLDGWYRENGAPSDMGAYKDFLKEIGYLLPEGPDFSVDTTNVDPEIASVAGPQLVVPIMNARFALNAANARWGSL
ncbi:MAG: malate synthase G, partial [Notoacmeibacter sp.]|nr:malate synthase G [Notoacmeibacter sp.]